MRPAQRRIEPLSVLPVFFDLKGKRAIVIGGSAAAAWKAELLAAAGAHVDVHDMRPGQQMLTLASNDGVAGAVRLVPAPWSVRALAGAALIVADAPTRAEAVTIYNAAHAAGVAVNLIDRPDFCDFQFGAIVNRSPLIIGISSSSAAPVLAQMARSRIESIIPLYVAAWAGIAARIRRLVSQRLPTANQRRAFWENFATRAMLGPPKDAGCVESCFQADAGAGRMTTIEVDAADDLTLRAIRALQTADVIHIEGRCPEGILDFARREAKRVQSSGDGPFAVTGEPGNIVIVRARSSQTGA